MKHRICGIIGIVITLILLILYLPPLLIYQIIDIGNIIGYIVAALVLVFSIQELVRAGADSGKRNYDRSQAGGTRGKLHRQFNHDMGRDTVLIERGGLGSFTADRSIGYDGDRTSHAPAIIWTIIFALIIAFYAQGLIRIASASTVTATESGSESSLVILGCGVRGRRPTRMLRQRIEAARLYLLTNQDIVAVASGGIGAGESISEASCIRDYLTSSSLADQDRTFFAEACRLHGVDAEQIISDNGGSVPVIDAHRVLVDQESSNTEENIGNAIKLLSDGEYPSSSLVLVTQGYHLYRSERIAAYKGAEAAGFTAPVEWWAEPTYATRECASLLYHLIDISH